jgi:hypothetical protein
MNKTLAQFLITLFIFVFMFAIFANAEQVAQQQARQPVRSADDIPPTCEKKDKGMCQAVCNVGRNPDGTSAPQGCAKAFYDDFQGATQNNRGILCRTDQLVILVGCDASTNEQCINRAGTAGVWCSCYYLCQDLPPIK